MTWRKREIMNMAREAGDATTDARGRQTQGEKHMNPLTMTDKELIEHASKQVQALRMALDMIECEKYERRHVRWAIIDALKEEAAAQPASVQKRPQNCGTGYCSCIECVMEPAPVQEPVAIALNTGTKQGVKWLKNVEHGVNLYTIPPAAQRKPLTDEEITLIIADCASSHQHTDIHLARAIEQAHGITGENK